MPNKRSAGNGQGQRPPNKNAIVEAAIKHAEVAIKLAKAAVKPAPRKPPTKPKPKFMVPPEQ